jgi:hypothetical protein
VDRVANEYDSNRREHENRREREPGLERDASDGSCYKQYAADDTGDNRLVNESESSLISDR